MQYLTLLPSDVMEEIISYLSGDAVCLALTCKEYIPYAEDACYTPASGLGLMRMYVDRGYTFSVEDTHVAAFNGNLDVLIWLRENGCDWDPITCSCAASEGHLHILKWLRENGCEWDNCVCSGAASGGHLDVIKWARENGCYWNGNACRDAALYGHLDVIKWLRENGCEWNVYTCYNAIHGGHLHVLQWAVENGCEYNKTMFLIAAGEYPDIVKWITENL